MTRATTQDKVLVLDGDMVSALAIARSLHRHGLRVDVASHLPKPLSAYSNAVHQTLQYPNPMSEEAAFLDWCGAHLADGGYQLLIPVTERTLAPLMRQRDRFDNAKLALPATASVEAALDKAKTLELAARLSIPAPKSATVDRLDQLDAIAQSFRFPVVVKPARSMGTQHGRTVQLSVDYAFDAQELQTKTRHALHYGSVLIQEYVAGTGVGIELIADHGEIAYAFQHQRLHEIPLTGGGSSLRVSVPINPALREAAAQLMRALAWHGVAMVEFKWDAASGHFHLMEINGRFWGSLPLAIAAGADFPVMLYELLVEGRIRPRPEAKIGCYGRGLTRDLYWYELALRRDAPARLVQFPTRGQLLKDALLIFSPRHHFDVQQWRDPLPGLVDLWRFVQGQVTRVSGLVGERLLARRLRRAWDKGEVARRLADARQMLFVCYGNINRSALAERCFQVRHPGMTIACMSAGFHEETGRPADPAMVEVARGQGIDMGNWSSRALNKDMIDNSDIIFVMEKQHFRRIAQSYPGAEERVFLLDSRGEIDDPYGKSPEVYARCAGKVSAGVERIAALLTRSLRA